MAKKATAPETPLSTEADRRSREAAVECARIADKRRGGEITVLHVEETITLTDYFILVSARNKRQIQAIAADMRRFLRESGYHDVRMEGYEWASWVLLDAGPIIVHIFREDLRGYYDLELLWGDAPKVEWRSKEE